MTSDKGRKGAIRARMAKTGERYTTARLYLLDLHREHETDDLGLDTAPVVEHGASAASPPADGPAEPVPGSATPLSPRVAEPEMGDAAIERGTGKGWDEWFALLDAWGGSERQHREIATHLQAEHGLGGWWAQSVTVGYERARGLRAVHQRPDGFSVSVSKTFPVSAERLQAAFVDDAIRDAWLEPGTLRPRSAQLGRSARFDVVADGTRLHVYVVAKGMAKATAQLQHERLATAAEVAEWRAFWRERLGRLAEVMAAEGAGG